MILAAALCLLSTQTEPLILPAAARPEFSEAVHSVEDALSKSDFGGAEAAAKLLPRPSFDLGWDDTAVPASMREDVAQARTLAIESWQRIKDYNVHLTAASEDLVIKFVSVLPNGPKKIPAAFSAIFGTSPRLTVLIGLHRGNPAEPVVQSEVFGEIARAIGAYFGVADNPLPGSVMYSSDEPAMRVWPPKFAELHIAAVNLNLSAILRKNITEHHSVSALAPDSSFGPDHIDMGDVKQGSKPVLSFNLANNGTGALQYELVPDCGCFSKTPAGVLEPGKSTVLQTTVNTSEYVGLQHKMLVLYSNDPKSPAREIPITFHAVPAFRLYRVEGDTVIVPKTGAKEQILLTLPSGSRMHPMSFQMAGFNAKVSIEPWSGTVADPDMDEPPKPRSGYRFTVKIPGNLMDGRVPGTLSVTTDDPEFPVLSYTIYAQKGILAFPSTVNLGEVRANQRESVLVTQPHIPFKVLGASTTSRFIRAVVVPGRGGWEYRVDVYYTGKAPVGDYSAVVRVRTSDVNRPLVEIPVRGIVR